MTALRRLSFAIVWMGLGALAMLRVVEHEAPVHPTFFCRPSGAGVCEPYPWSRE